MRRNSEGKLLDKVEFLRVLEGSFAEKESFNGGIVLRNEKYFKTSKKVQKVVQTWE